MSFLKWRSIFGRWGRSRRVVFSGSKDFGFRTPGGRLQLESLEDRCTPTAGLSVNQQYVSQLYVALLNRAADSTGLTTYTNLLDHGASRTQVALAIETAPSNEFQTILVQNMYQTILNRQGDASGVTNWVKFMATHGFIQTEAAIAGGPEFFQQAGSTNSGFVTLLYQRFLGRSPDAAGLATWTHALNIGHTRTQVAAGIVTSAEYRTDLVNSIYKQYLNSPPSSTSLSQWVNALGSGTSEQTVVANVVSSTTFLNQPPPAPTVTNPTSPIDIFATSFIIQGTAQAGSLVQIFKGSTVVGSQQLSNSTSFNISVPLTAGTVYNLTATDTNALGKKSTTATIPTITADANPPTVTVSSSLSGTTNVDAIPVTVTFNEDVVGFTSANVVVGNGKVADFAGSGKVFTFNVLPTTDGAVTVSVPANAVNSNTASNTLTIQSMRADALATVNPLTTNNTTPTISGTVSQLNSTVSIKVGGQTITATVVGNTWTATVLTPLSPNSYSVDVTATDVAGNASTTTSNNVLVVDTTAPVVTINDLTTANPTPTLTGTVSKAATVKVTVAGQTFTAVVSGTGWSAAVPTALADGTYDISVTATDAAGNVGSNTATSGLVIDATPSGTAPGVTVNPLTTNNATPTLSGTVSDPVASVQVTVDSQTFAATVVGNTWTATVPTGLAENTYTVDVSATDGGGTGNGSGQLIVDTTAPVVTINKVSATSSTPTLSGSLNDPTASVAVTVAGQTFKATVTASGWTAVVPTAIASGTYDVSVTATDPAGNVDSQSGPGDLTVAIPPANSLPFFLTDNNWQTLASGVRIWTVKSGSGTAAAAGNNIVVNYIGYLTNGTVFDSSFGRNQTFSTPLSSSSVIVGWVDGIPGMQPGEERRLDIPSSLGYGAAGHGTVPPNSELIFDVTMISATP